MIIRAIIFHIKIIVEHISFLENRKELKYIVEKRCWQNILIIINSLGSM